MKSKWFSYIDFYAGHIQKMIKVCNVCRKPEYALQIVSQSGHDGDGEGGRGMFELLSEASEGADEHGQ